MMPLQRACGAESQVRNKLSNGPLRVRRNCNTKYSVTCGHTSVAGDMLVSCIRARSRREDKVAPRIMNYSSLTESEILSRTFF